MLSYRLEVERRTRGDQATAASHTTISNLYELACECDRLREQVIERGRYLTRQAAQFTDKAERGEQLYGSSPVSGSQVTSLITETAALHAIEPHFWRAFTAVFDARETRLLREQIEGEVEAGLDATAPREGFRKGPPATREAAIDRVRLNEQTISLLQRETEKLITRYELAPDDVEVAPVPPVSKTQALALIVRDELRHDDLMKKHKITAGEVAEAVRAAR